MLGVSHLSFSTEKKISSAAHETFKEWKMLKTVSIFFYATASNSGRLNGSCELLELMLYRPILFLAGWNHILEIILQFFILYFKLLSMLGPEFLFVNGLKPIREK